jgi:alginate O-acetyltransferase complex protein AlgI
MLFNSYIYIFAFFPLVLFLYFYLNRMRLVLAAKAWLVFASLFFYSYWNPIYLPIILGSMLINYGIGTALSKSKDEDKISQKTVLIAGVFINIALLGYYKYADFFISTVNNVIGLKISTLNLILPLAISFFTFQQIAWRFQ